MNGLQNMQIMLLANDDDYRHTQYAVQYSSEMSYLTYGYFSSLSTLWTLDHGNITTVSNNEDEIAIYHKGVLNVLKFFSTNSHLFTATLKKRNYIFPL